ncbi:hypothetical protein ACFRCW_38880 [Streptomyces sp. NPDC056653]|uniref:hypothetical protein n=1 Tax=Streptomyces sp. NPDC056653 TaxID=3345894 RepID=UPI0036C89D2C
MNKLTRRIANAIAAVTVAGGAFLAAGGSATAAPLLTPGHTPARATVTADVHVAILDHRRHDGTDGRSGYQFNDHDRRHHHHHHHHHHHGSSFRWDDYNDYWHRNADTRFDPWIADQLSSVAHDADAS